MKFDTLVSWLITKSLRTIARVNIHAEEVSSVYKVVLSIPLTSKLRTSAVVRMLPDGMDGLGKLVFGGDGIAL